MLKQRRLLGVASGIQRPERCFCLSRALLRGERQKPRGPPEENSVRNFTEGESHHVQDLKNKTRGCKRVLFFVLVYSAARPLSLPLPRKGKGIINTGKPP